MINVEWNGGRKFLLQLIPDPLLTQTRQIILIQLLLQKDKNNNRRYIDYHDGG